MYGVYDYLRLRCPSTEQIGVLTAHMMHPYAKALLTTKVLLSANY